MCKCCDYVLNPEVNDAMDLIESRFDINDMRVGYLGVDLIPGYRNLSEHKRIARIRLYVKPLDDDYFTQGEVEVNFCPMCGRDLRNLPVIVED